jgi:hypothetical protein
LLTDDPQAAQHGLELLEAAFADAPSPDPMQRRVLHSVESALNADRLFEGRLAEDFLAIAACTISYVARRLDAPRPWMRDDWQGDDPKETVKEMHLADDYEDWLSANCSRGTLNTEVRRISAGRADVLAAFGTWKVVVELKRELDNAERDSLEEHYADQAASYQATDYPFGIVVVLDRSQPQTRATPHLQDLVWVSQAQVEGRGRWLMWCVVPARRVTPSALTAARR